jgi:hypothetical protein
MLYSLVSDPLITVEQAILKGVSNIQFTGSLPGSCLVNFHRLQLLTFHISLLDDVEDQIYWRWNISGQFKVHFLYEWLNNSGCSVKIMKLYGKPRYHSKSNIYVVR